MGAPTAIAWILPEHAPLVRDALRNAGLTLRAVGCPVRGETQGLADGFDAEPLDDLRAALASADTDVALLTAPPGRDAAPPDARAVQAAESRGVKIASMGPFSAGLIDAAEHGLFREQSGARPADAIRLVPRARRHPVFRAAEEVLQNFGEIDLVSIESNAPPACGGLPAALLGALDIVALLIGVPELVDAAAAGAPKRLSDIAGHTAALLRFPDGRSGQVSATERAAWGWRATASGAQGRLTLRPSGFDWYGPAGEKHDEHRADKAWCTASAVLADSLRELIDPASPRGPVTPWADLLSMADAALLSARTGQAESPATILRAAQSTPD